MKSAQRDGVVGVGPSASSDKVSLAQDVKKQPQNAIPQCFAGDRQSSWRLVTSYHTRNRYLAGVRVKPSSHKVNHRFTRRTAFPPTRGQDNDPAFPSSRKEKSKTNAKVGRQQAKSRVKLSPAELAVNAVAETPVHVNVLAVPPAARKHPAVAAPADRGTTKTVSLTLPALPASPCESQVLHETNRMSPPLQKCCLPATTTSSQGGKVSFVSLWRLLYGMLFAMLLQLDLCGAAAVASGAAPPPPPPRHTLWKDSLGAGSVAKDVPAASQVRPAELSSLRGHKEVNSAHTSNHAALSIFQNSSTNSTSYSWLLTSAPSGSYEAIACSDNGQHVVAGNYHGYLFTSNDYGATWNQSLSVLGYYLDIASSSDGQYWAAVSFSVGIFVSSDYGRSWNLTSAAPIGWYSIASSGNGQYLSAATHSESIYTSNDYGHTWHATSAGVANWRAIDCSDSGHFLAAVAWNFGVYTSSDYGVTWMIAPLPLFLMYFNVPAITVSRTGQYLSLLSDDSLYTSSNYGYSWTQLVPYTYWNYFSASGNGHYLAGSNKGVEFSEDYGANWVALSAPNFALNDAALTADSLSGYGFNSGAIYRMSRLNDSNPSVSHQWQAISAPSALYRSVACSHSGQHVVAGAAHGYLYTSNDYGVTWHVSFSTVGNYFEITSSSSGQYWAAIAEYDGLFISSDFGQSWSRTSIQSSVWNSVTSSNSGQYLYAVPGIYKSSDYGQTWHTAFSGTVYNWGSIKTSDSGQYVLATSQSSGMYMSGDYGATWRVFFPAGIVNWHSITVSSSGQHLAAAGDEGQYISSDYGASWSGVLPIKYWQSLSSSGTELVAVNYEGVFTSDDYGVTWALSSEPFFLLSRVTLSADGQYAYGVGDGNSNTIYKWTRDIVPQLAEPSAQPSNSPVQDGNTCPGGTYRMQSSQPTSLCAICPGGTYSTEGMNSCLSCPAGTFSTAWSSSCTECPAGFYCLWGASAAVMCPSGTISSAGASFCTACPVGQYSHAGTSTCLTCTAA